MRFQFNNVDQVGSYLMKNMLPAMNKSVENFAREGAKKTILIRLSAPVIGISNTLVISAAAVALVAESIIKGLGNIIGAAFFNRGSLSGGVAQLVGGLTLVPIFAAILIALSIKDGIAKTLQVAINPKGIKPSPANDTLLFSNREGNHVLSGSSPSSLRSARAGSSPTGADARAARRAEIQASGQAFQALSSDSLER